jgi:hypothetical protein
MTFICQQCTYETERKCNWIKHIKTDKHIKQIGKMPAKTAPKKPNTIYSCDSCGKQYKYLSGLSRHKIICGSTSSLEDKEYIKNQQVQIQTLQNLLEKSIENNKSTLNNIIPRIGNTTTNISNQMTINLFLNEECKNAMNLTDFVNQLHLSLDDLQYTKDNGYIKGITNIFVKNLVEMPINSRPIHCSDKKKLQFYVKDENKWEKDSQNEKIDKSINDITQRQIKKIKDWESDHPNWCSSDEQTSMYIDIVKTVMGGMDANEKQLNLDSIKKEIGNKFDLQQAIEEN